MMELDRETSTKLEPRFDADGLVTAVVVDARDSQPLMVAHMNAEAIRLTLGTGQVHFWSRSRQCLWLKGETSGNKLKLVEMRVDCDQDALLVLAEPTGPSCHTGRRSCFYRSVRPDGQLLWLEPGYDA